MHMQHHALTRLRWSRSEARVGGMVGGKCGLVHVHVGTGPGRLAPLRDALAASDVPISQFLPTHMERSKQLVDEGLQWLRAGGSIDFTAGKDVRPACVASIPCLRTLHMMLHQYTSILVCVSSPVGSSYVQDAGMLLP